MSLFTHILRASRSVILITFTHGSDGCFAIVAVVSIVCWKFGREQLMHKSSIKLSVLNVYVFVFDLYKRIGGSRTTDDGRKQKQTIFGVNGAEFAAQCTRSLWLKQKLPNL